MKNLCSVLLLLISSADGYAQNTMRENTLEQLVAGKPIQRSYWTYVPNSVTENPALVVVLHGYSGSAVGIAEYSNMNAVAEEAGFVVAYPQGTIDQEGNAFFNVGYAFHQNVAVDDVDFVRRMISELRTEYAVDSDQIFATGMSNGGEMSYLLACRASTLFRAVAPIAGSMVGLSLEDCSPERPIPIFAISGTDDPVTVYSGDLENAGGWGPYLGQDETIAYWARQYGLEQRTSTALANPHKPMLTGDSHITWERYSNDNLTTEIWFYRVVNGGHDWPGAKSTEWWRLSTYPALMAMGFGKNHDIDASREIWAFFSLWSDQETVGSD
jgi:polyhydroxybutyrate depolymerase